MTHAALLRGINVGGHTAVKMTELKACFEKLGFSSVQTYINSGNVVFVTDLMNPRGLEAAIEQALTATFGHQIAVIVRNFDEMKRVMDYIPHSWWTSTDKKCNVIFLRQAIDNAEILKELAPKENIEELHYGPGVLLWAAKTSDLTKSNMIKINRLGIYKDMTVRNLNTTCKIYELMQITAQTTRT